MARTQTYVTEVQERTMNVLNQLCNGDMIMTLGAFAAIYPNLWRLQLSEQEYKQYKADILKEATQYI